MALRHAFIVMVAAAFGGACGTLSGRAGSDASEHHHHGMTHRFDDATSWARKFDDPGRDAWQRPDEVLRAMALSPDMAVADVGAGTGYFSVRLARALPRGEVFATDVEPEMVRYLDERARREALPNVRAHLATAQTTGLAPHCVDRVLIVNTWHHLEDRVAYARDIAASLRSHGKVFVVDFDRTSPRGPPPQFRLEPEAVVHDLQAAGLTATVSTVALPGQYIVEGTLLTATTP